jgi:tetratricopeptide (TPR) repeat protein
VIRALATRVTFFHSWHPTQSSRSDAIVATKMKTKFKHCNEDRHRLRWWATEFLNNGKVELATSVALQCYRNSCNSRDSSDKIHDILLLGLCFAESNMFWDAKVCAEDGRRLVESCKEDLQVVSAFMRVLAELNFKIGLKPEAVSCYEKHCVYCEKINGTENLVTSDAYSLFGCVLASMGEYRRGLQYCQKALEIRTLKLGDLDLRTANSRYNTGLIMRMVGQLDCSRKELSAAHFVRSQLAGTFSLPTAEVDMSLGYTQEQRGYLNDAANKYERAFRIRKAILGPENRYTLEAFNYMNHAIKSAKKIQKGASFQEKLFQIKDIDGAIDHVNARVRFRNIVRRCNILNPCLQAELVAVTESIDLSSRDLCTHFPDHVDLIETLLERIKEDEHDTHIKSCHMLKQIDLFLSTVTENEPISFQMRQELLSAAPLSNRKILNLFAGDIDAQQAVKMILEVLESNFCPVQREEQRSRKTWTVRVLTAICKLNARKLSTGCMPVINVNMAERLLMATYNSNINLNTIVKITRSNSSVGKAMIQQLIADDKKLQSNSNFDSYFDESRYSAEDILTAYTITNELNNGMEISTNSLSVLVKSAAKKKLKIDEILKFLDVPKSILQRSLFPILKSMHSDNVEYIFRTSSRKSLVMPTDEVYIGDTNLFFAHNDSVNENGELEVTSSWRSQKAIPFSEQKYSSDEKPLLDTINNSSSRLLGKAINEAAKVLSDTELNTKVLSNILEDVALSRIQTFDTLRLLLEGRVYGNFDDSGIFLSKLQDTLIGAHTFAGEQRDHYSLGQISYQQYDNSDKNYTIEHLQQLRLKYPHLREAIDEIAADLKTMFTGNTTQTKQGEKKPENQSAVENTSNGRNKNGRRIKMVPVTPNELWQILRSKLMTIGIFLKIGRARKRRSVYSKTKLTGIFIHLLAMKSIKRSCVLLQCTAIFSYLLESKKSSATARLRNNISVDKGGRLTNTQRGGGKFSGPKLRAVHWSTVNENQTKGTIWEGRKRTFSTVKHIFEDVEDVFAPGTTQGKVANGPKIGKKKSAVSLLEPKRTQNLGIALARVWTGSYADLAIAITVLNSEQIGLDNVEQLIKIAPSAEEMSLVKSFQGDLVLLNKADRFVYELSSVPRLSERLRVMVYCGRFNENLLATIECIRLIESASAEIIGSEKFPELLGIILSLGNKLNQNTRKQLAAGIKIDSLTKLATTKGKTGITVLEYMVENLLKRNPDILLLSEDFSHLKSAAAVNFGVLINDVNKLRTGLNLLAKQLTLDEKVGEDNFATEYGAFYEKAKIKIEHLNLQLASMRDTYGRASQWLFENPQKTEPAILFTNIIKFLTALESTKIKVEEKYERLRKAAEREEKKKNKLGRLNVVSRSPMHPHELKGKGEIKVKSRRLSVDAWADEEEESD